MNLEKSLAFYKDRYADASDFTFVFVGSFDLPDHQAAGRAISRQPAGAPPQGSRQGCRHHAAVRRGGEGRQQRHRPRRARSAWSSAVRFKTIRRTASSCARWRIRSRATCSAFERRPRRHLWCECRAGVYETTDRQYRITITFACDPARTQDLVKALFSVVDDFKTNGPSARTSRRRAVSLAARLGDEQPPKRIRAQPAVSTHISTTRQSPK